MSYLKQKKRKKSETLFLNISSIILAFATLTIFLNDQLSTELNNYRLQIYLITLILLIFSLFKKKILYIFAFTTLSFINYSSISAYANILTNKKLNTKQEVIVNFDTLSKTNIEIKEINELSLVLINFSKSKNKEKELEILNEIVSSKNTPSTIIGDFGLPLWHPAVKKLIQKTGLSSKNKLIFNNYKPFYIPTINVLGFNNIGVKQIIKKNNTFAFILLAK